MAAVRSPGPFNDNFPTPPESSIAPSTHGPPLPKPRKHPLKSGGPKESELIRYLDHALGNVVKNVQNRPHRRRRASDGMEEVRNTEGYATFAEAAKDLDGVVDVVWVSGSPNLQVPYLINVAVTIIDSLPLFPPVPRSTFRLIDKLDAAFAALLQGRDPDTNETLPGFETGRTVSTTDKVRIKGIVERTRLLVVKVMSGEEGEDVDMDADTGGETEDEKEMVQFEGFEDNEEDEWEERHVASVFEKTLAELGDVLGGPPIGIITDDCAPDTGRVGFEPL